jgi:hypothetical protein
VRELTSCNAIHVARIDPVVIYRVKASAHLARLLVL